jgi:predicted RNase H-like HicB family nuclease
MENFFNHSITIKKRKNWYLASCPSLDVHSQGGTEEEAKKHLEEAIRVFLLSCRNHEATKKEPPV